jgi:hypothetical protein
MDGRGGDHRHIVDRRSGSTCSSLEGAAPEMRKVRKALVAERPGRCKQQ